MAVSTPSLSECTSPDLQCKSDILYISHLLTSYLCKNLSKEAIAGTWYTACFPVLSLAVIPCQAS